MVTQVGYMFCDGRRNTTDVECNQQFWLKILLIHCQTTEGGDNQSGGTFAGSRKENNEACLPIPEKGKRGPVNVQFSC